LSKPDTIEHVWIDPDTGLRADSGCAGARELPFAEGSAPAELSPCAGDVPARVRGWLQRLFGR
jgi:penicillin-binding protein 1B